MCHTHIHLEYKSRILIPVRTFTFWLRFFKSDRLLALEMNLDAGLIEFLGHVSLEISASREAQGEIHR